MSVQAPVQYRRPVTWGLEVVYVFVFVAIELLGITHPLAAGICHGGMVMVLLNHYVVVERDRPEPMLLALAVCSLYRLLALTPLPTNVFTNHLVLVGAPALMGTVLALRVTGVPSVSSRPRPALSVGLQF